MTPTVESSKSVVVECSSLTVEERDALEAFLLKQPDVRSIDRRVRARNPHPPESDTVAYLFHLSQATTALIMQGGVSFTVWSVEKLLEAWLKRRKRKKKPREAKEDLTIVVVGDNNTIRIGRAERD